MIYQAKLDEAGQEKEKVLISVATSHTELTVAFNKIMKRITKNENIYLTKADRMASMKNSAKIHRKVIILNQPVVS